MHPKPPIFLILLLTLTLACPAPCQAGFDDPDPAEETFDLTEEDTIFQDTPDTPPPFKSRLPRFFSESTWTLGYTTSLKTGDDPEWIDNHLFLRQELQTLVYDKYFLRLDWKGRLNPKSDHTADAQNKNLHTDADLREAYIQAQFGRHDSTDISSFASMIEVVLPITCSIFQPA